MPPKKRCKNGEETYTTNKGITKTRCRKNSYGGGGGGGSGFIGSAIPPPPPVRIINPSRTVNTRDIKSKGREITGLKRARNAVVGGFTEAGKLGLALASNVARELPYDDLQAVSIGLGVEGAITGSRDLFRNYFYNPGDTYDLIPVDARTVSKGAYDFTKRFPESANYSTPRFLFEVGKDKLFGGYNNFYNSGVAGNIGRAVTHPGQTAVVGGILSYATPALAAAAGGAIVAGTKSLVKGAVKAVYRASRDRLHGVLLGLQEPFTGQGRANLEAKDTGRLLQQYRHHLFLDTPYSKLGADIDFKQEVLSDLNEVLTERQPYIKSLTQDKRIDKEVRRTIAREYSNLRDFQNYLTAKTSNFKVKEYYQKDAELYEKHVKRLEEEERQEREQVEAEVETLGNITDATLDNASRAYGALNNIAVDTSVRAAKQAPGAFGGLIPTVYKIFGTVSDRAAGINPNSRAPPPPPIVPLPEPIAAPVAASLSAFNDEDFLGLPLIPGQINARPNYLPFAGPQGGLFEDTDEEDNEVNNDLNEIEEQVDNMIRDTADVNPDGFAIVAGPGQAAIIQGITDRVLHYKGLLGELQGNASHERRVQIGADVGGDLAYKRFLGNYTAQAPEQIAQFDDIYENVRNSLGIGDPNEAVEV
jgi:hypothetical protein